jgi:hypothetical protein
LSSSLQSKNVNIKIYRTETWSFTLRKEHRLTVFKNRGLRRISRPKKNKVTGLILPRCYSGNKIKMNEVNRACSMYGREGRCIQSFGG